MIRRVLISVAIAFSLIAPVANAQLFGGGKKKYDAMVASWPAVGARPSDEVAKAVALAYFNSTLKDPYSAHYEWGIVEEGTVRGAFERWGTPGWIVHVNVNARNSYGGYTGMTPYKIVLRSNYIAGAYQYDTRLQDWRPLVGNTPIPPPANLPAIEPQSAGSTESASAPCEACKAIKPKH